SCLFNGSGDFEGNILISVITIALIVVIAVDILLCHPLEQLQCFVDFAFVQCDLDQERGVLGLLKESEQLRTQGFPATKLPCKIAQLLVTSEIGLSAEQAFEYF